MPKYQSEIASHAGSTGATGPDGVPDDGLGPLTDALANPRRRAVVTVLAGGPATTSDLAARVGAALPTMQQHLEILRRAGLVTSTKRGRTVTHAADLTAFDALTDWITTRRSFWTNQLDALARSMEARP